MFLRKIREYFFEKFKIALAFPKNMGLERRVISNYILPNNPQRYKYLVDRLWIEMHSLIEAYFIQFGRCINTHTYIIDPDDIFNEEEAKNYSLRLKAGLHETNCLIEKVSAAYTLLSSKSDELGNDSTKETLDKTKALADQFQKVYERFQGCLDLLTDEITPWDKLC